MAGTYSPNPALQFLDNNGDPAASYQLFTYLAGTSTKVSTYTDVELTTANTNPIVLDSAGRCTIFLDPGVSYKFVLATDTDTDPPASPVWTRDDISGVPEAQVQSTVTGTAGEALSAGECVYLSAGDGSRTAGRWYLTDADNDYASSTADAVGFATTAIASGSTGNILLVGRLTDLSGLTAGTLYYASATAGEITATAPTNRKVVGVADSTTTLIVGRSEPLHFSQAPTFDPGTSDPASMISQVVGSFYRTASSSGTGNGAGAETVLGSTTIAANTIDSNGHGIEVYASGSTANNANADKQLRVRFGATTLSGTVFYDTSAQTVQNKKWSLRVLLYRTGSAAQTSDSTWACGTAGALSLYGTDVVSGTEDWTVANLIEVTGVGTSASDVVLNTMQVKIF